MKAKIAIIGAGPVGIEAALYAVELGFDVEVFEKGDIGASLRDWGHVTLFSPWHMNRSSLGPIKLKHHFLGWIEPEKDTYQTGSEFLESYLDPLAKLLQLSAKIHTHTEVLSVGKERILKGEMIDRSSYPFKILTRNSQGHEKYYAADILIDASGVYRTPNWLGEGGIPALGEQACRDKIDYHLVNLSDGNKEAFGGKKTLIVGAGYSAATTISDFVDLVREAPSSQAIWIARSDRIPPIEVIENDPLPNRARLTETANKVAKGILPQIQFRPNTVVESVFYDSDKQSFKVGVKTGNQYEELQVDRILANVGYGPDNSIYQELQIHECYASKGPMKLAAALLATSSDDCLSQESMGSETLKNPEPNFFIIGHKSYGRNSSFLVRLGLSQIVEVFSIITENNDLNLYHAITSEEQSR